MVSPVAEGLVVGDAAGDALGAVDADAVALVALDAAGAAVSSVADPQADRSRALTPAVAIRVRDGRGRMEGSRVSVAVVRTPVDVMAARPRHRSGPDVMTG
jgi:hypothetical protein